MKLRLLFLFLSLTTLQSLVKSDEESVRTVIGIGLGTSYSCLCVSRNGKVEIIPDGQDPSEERLWKMDATLSKVITLIKSDKLDELVTQEDRNDAAKQLVFLFHRMKKSAQSHLQDVVSHAVVAVPAYFNESQRKFIQDAAEIASLAIIETIDEPIAVGIAYDLEKSVDKKTAMVFDIGGSTFDLSILNIENGAMEIVANNKENLGGEDFNQRVLEHFVQIYEKKNKNLIKDNKALEKLLVMIERVKRVVSTADKLTVKLKKLFDGPVKDFSETLTRVKFEELNKDLFEYVINVVEKVLMEANMKKEGIDEIILIGGSSRIPKIQQLVKEFFSNKEPLEKDINPDEVMAYGAAVKGGLLSSQDEKSPKDEL